MDANEFARGLGEVLGNCAAYRPRRHSGNFRMVKNFKAARSISMADARIVAMIVARFVPLSIARARWRLARPNRPAIRAVML